MAIIPRQPSRCDAYSLLGGAVTHYGGRGAIGPPRRAGASGGTMTPCVPSARVTIDDRPSSLGQLAVSGGSVARPSSRWRSSNAATSWSVDDIVVDLPLGALPVLLITAATERPVPHVDSVRTVRRGAGRHRTRTADHVATAHGDRLARSARRRTAARAPSWATVVTTTDSGGR